MVKRIFKSKNFEATTLKSVQIQSRTGLELVSMVTGRIRRISNEQPEERAKDLTRTNPKIFTERTGLRPRYTVTYHIPSTRFI